PPRPTTRARRARAARGSREIEGLPSQIFGAFDRNQHCIALFVRVAVLLGLDQPLPDLVINRSRFVDFRRAIEAGDAAARQYPILDQRRLAVVYSQLAAVLHCVCVVTRDAYQL